MQALALPLTNHVTKLMQTPAAFSLLPSPAIAILRYQNTSLHIPQEAKWGISCQLGSAGSGLLWKESNPEEHQARSETSPQADLKTLSVGSKHHLAQVCVVCPECAQSGSTIFTQNQRDP